MIEGLRCPPGGAYTFAIGFRPVLHFVCPTDVLNRESEPQNKHVSKDDVQTRAQIEERSKLHAVFLHHALGGRSVALEVVRPQLE